ncbi:MAG TPA: aldehyde dehydrogenase (NADP(+)), partial [Terracidiphilus sp.]|nr:aldehyde dehydrogenase (NADP(+)) [Terracidiphilus sp.]
NPVFILPGALAQRGNALATGLFGSFTLGAGQFCTKPGMVFLPEQSEAAAFLSELRRLTQESGAFSLLTPAIAANYDRLLEERKKTDGLASHAAPASGQPCGTAAALLEVQIGTFLAKPALSEEIFGPTTLLIRYDKREAMMHAAEELEGHLTATILGTPEDLAAHRDLIAVLERKAGRVLFNGFPTGVEVCDAMVHGGPYPSSSDSRFTSVGTRAIARFARPVCYQGFPEAELPEELHNANPRGIWRMVNSTFTRDPIAF